MDFYGCIALRQHESIRGGGGCRIIRGPITQYIASIKPDCRAIICYRPEYDRGLIRCKNIAFGNKSHITQATSPVEVSHAEIYLLGTWSTNFCSPARQRWTLGSGSRIGNGEETTPKIGKLCGKLLLATGQRLHPRPVIGKLLALSSS